LFAMMVAVICGQNIEIESVQVYYILYVKHREFQNVKITLVEDLCVGTTIETKICGGNKPAVSYSLYAEISMVNVMQTVSELFIGSI